MGTVLSFPKAIRGTRCRAGAATESATVIILPVVRIERYSEMPAEPEPSRSQRRRRRRRAARD